MNSSASFPSSATWMSLASLWRRNARMVSSTSDSLSSTSRISTPWLIIHSFIHCRFKLLDLARRRRAEGEEKSRPFLGLRIRPDPAPMSFDDPLDDGKPHARAFEVARLVQA